MWSCCIEDIITNCSLKKEIPYGNIMLGREGAANHQ